METSSELKISGGTSKQVLRRILYKYVPSQFFERPKAGFAVPLHDWLRGPLRIGPRAFFPSRASGRTVFSIPNRFGKCGLSTSAASAIGNSLCGPY